MHDRQTLAFYADEAPRYAARYEARLNRDLERFLALLPPGAHILELGCGGGQDSAAMLTRGYHPVPTDGSPEMAAEASRRLGLPVRTLLFEELDETDRYHGVWASACLLHVPLPALSGVLARVHRALHPGGWFYASYKAGRREGRDSLGRYYSYPTQAVLDHAYRMAADWGTLTIAEQAGSGYDQRPTDWLIAVAGKQAAE